MEQRYSCHEREAFGMVSAILYFHTILLGTLFILWTDHKSLMYWLTRPPVNQKYSMWLVKLQDMTFEVKYIAGEKNVLADLLLRPGEIQKSSLKEKNH